MKTVRKMLVLFTSCIYIFFLLYSPINFSRLLETDKNQISLNKSEKESLATPAKAQSNPNQLLDPQFKRTSSLALRTYPWGQDRYGGFTKIGEIKDNAGTSRVIAVGYGRL